MGLIIEKNKKSKLTIKGTSVSIPKIYVRLEVNFEISGNTASVGVYCYESKQKFKENSSNTINIEGFKTTLSNFKTNKQTFSEVQKEVKRIIQDEGFLVTIVDMD